MNETELVKGCCRGDNTARRRLYELYAGPLMAVCLRYVGSREAAHDVLHDAFLRVFRSFDKFVWQGDGSLRAWLTRIVVNEALGYLRSRKALAELPVETLPEVEEDEPEEGNLDIPLAVLMEFVRALPVGYRTVLSLYVFEGKSHREIADLLGINERTSSSQLSRARAMLIKNVNQYKRRMQDEERR